MRCFRVRPTFCVAALISLFFPLSVMAGGSLTIGLSDMPSGQFEDVELDAGALTLLGHWTNSAPSFSARSEMGFAYDHVRRESVIFGGADHTGATFGDTWIQSSNGVWSQSSPIGPPEARHGHELVWTGDKYLLFGGKNASGVHLRDTWIYDVAANTWTYVVTPDSPTARAHFAMAYSSTAHQVVLFGGQGAGEMATDDFTWTFDVAASSWTRLVLTPNPSFRQGHVMAYDPGADRMILFGGRLNGWSVGDVYNDTWALDVAGQSWTDLSPATPPGARANGALLYDATYQQMVLFGGRNPETFYMGDTTFFSFSQNRWTPFLVTSSPSGRYGHKMAYSTATATGRVVGGRRDVASNVVWSYTLKSTGAWTSAAVNVPGLTPFTWNTLSVSHLDLPIPAGVEVDVQLAASTDNVTFDSFRGPGGATTAYYVITDSSTVTLWNGHSNQRYLKLRAQLVSNDIPFRPHVTAFNFTYNQGPSTAPLISPSNQTILNSLRPTFRWQLSGDNDGDTPLLYHLEIADTTGFASPQVSEENLARGASDVSFTLLSDLPQGTWYWRTRSKDPAGLYGNWSNPFTITIDTTTPPSPLSVLTAAKGPVSGQVVLSWTFPGDTGGLFSVSNATAVTRFTTFGPITSESDWDAAPGQHLTLFSGSPGATVQHLISGLSDATSYYFAVKTVNSFGVSSLISSTSPLAVTNARPLRVPHIEAVKGSVHREMNVTWIFPGDDGGTLPLGTAYVHYSTQGPILTESEWAAADEKVVPGFSANVGDILTTVVPNLLTETSYYFNVRVEDPEGYLSALSTVSPRALTNAVPATVSAMTARTGLANNAIDLLWTFPGDDSGSIQGGRYFIRRSTSAVADEVDWSAAGGEQSGTFNAAPGQVLISTFTGLAEATTYFFAMKIEDAEGARSSLSSVSPSTITNAPPAVVLLHPKTAGPIQQITTIRWTMSDPNDDAVLTPSIFLSGDGGATYPVTLADLPSGTSFYTWSTQSLPNGNTYRIQVRVADPKGLSGSDASSGNLEKNAAPVQPSVTFSAVPQLQTIAGTVSVAWTLSNSSVYSTYQFNLEISSNSGLSFASVYSGTETAVMFDSTAWPNGDAYKFRISVTDAGLPPLTNSSEAGRFTINNPLPPNAFNLLYPLASDWPLIFGLRFSWEASSDSNGDTIVYTLHYSTDPGLNGGVVLANLTQTTYHPALGSLDVDTTYYWRVTAEDSTLLSRQSDLAQFRIDRTRARSDDRALSIETLSPLPSGGYISIEDAAQTHADLLEQSRQDSVSDRLIKILSYPAWNIQIKDITSQPVTAYGIRSRLTFTTAPGVQSQAVRQSSVEQDQLKIATLNSSLGRWEIIPTQSALDSVQLQAVADDFSVFSVVAAQAPANNLSGLTNFPNPFAAGKEATKIRYVLTEDSQVTIRIYTLMGELVHVATYDSGADGGVGTALGFTNEVSWNGRNGDGDVVANGMYLTEIKAEGPTGSRKEIRRIGVLK